MQHRPDQRQQSAMATASKTGSAFEGHFPRPMSWGTKLLIISALIIFMAVTVLVIAQAIAP